MSDVMDRIREAVAKAQAGRLAGDRERPSFPRVAAQSPFPPESTPEDYLARFQNELETLTGKVYGPFDAEGVAAAVVDLVREKATDEASGSRQQATGDAEASAKCEVRSALELQPDLRTSPITILSWNDEELGVPGLEERLREAGIEMVAGEVPNDEHHQGVLERLASLEVGLSGAVAGLADTGSIVVASGAGRSRLASLLPPVHIAVLPVSRLYPTMHDWITDGGADLARKTANLVVITGPSRTSDIELQLTLGMHGPKELYIVLYEA
jgi:L-lactate dehydrogenase complex protein LldG